MSSRHVMVILETLIDAQGSCFVMAADPINQNAFWDICLPQILATSFLEDGLPVKQKGSRMQSGLLAEYPSYFYRFQASNWRCASTTLKLWIDYIDFFTFS